MRGASATAPTDLPGDLGRRIADGDARAIHELVAARASAVHAYAIAIGMSEGLTGFVAAVLAVARGAYDVDQQLLAAAQGMSSGQSVSRRRRRRAERSFAEACAQAVPIAVAGVVLRTLEGASPAEPPTARAPGRAPGKAHVVPVAPRSTGPGDWVPASLRHVNGVSHPHRPDPAAPPAFGPPSP